MLHYSVFWVTAFFRWCFSFLSSLIRSYKMTFICSSMPPLFFRFLSLPFPPLVSLCLLLRCLMNGSILVGSVHPFQSDTAALYVFAPNATSTIISPAMHTHSICGGIPVSHTLDQGLMVYSWLGRMCCAIKAHAAGSCLAACPTDSNRREATWFSGTSAHGHINNCLEDSNDLWGCEKVSSSRIGALYNIINYRGAQIHATLLLQIINEH